VLQALLTFFSDGYLLSCVSVILACVAILSHGLAYQVALLSYDFVHLGNPTIDDVLCVVVLSTTLTSVCVMSEKLGLVVITLERYFKIVHVIAHRKYYRTWMTKVGVALPWIGGACLTLFPAVGTTRVVNGQCLKFGVWPTEGMLKVIIVHYNTIQYDTIKHFAL